MSDGNPLGWLAQMIAQLAQEYAHPEVDAPAGTGEPMEIGLTYRQMPEYTGDVPPRAEAQRGALGDPKKRASIEWFINSGLADTLTALTGRSPAGGVGVNWNPEEMYAGEWLPGSHEITLGHFPPVPYQMDPEKGEYHGYYEPILPAYGTRLEGKFLGEANLEDFADHPAGELIGSLHHPELTGGAETTVEPIKKNWWETQPEELSEYNRRRMEKLHENRRRFPHLFQPGNEASAGFGTMVHEWGHMAEQTESFTPRTIRGVMRQFDRYMQRYPSSYPGGYYREYKAWDQDLRSGRYDDDPEKTREITVKMNYLLYHAHGEYFATTFERGVGVLRQTRHLKKKEAQAVVNREQEAWPGLSVMIRSLLKAPIFAMHPLVRSDQTSSGQSK